MLDIISFLTRIPIKKEIKIEEVANKSYLFPFVAALIGFIVACVAFISFRFFIDNFATFLTLLSFYFITGLLHLDGLADFFDGIMASGGKEEKIKAMKDEKIGISGLFASFFVIILLFISIKAIGVAALAHANSFYNISSAIIISEVSAKISMNTCIFFGKGIGAINEGGMGATVIRRFSKSKYLFSLFSSILISLIALFHFFIVFTGIILAIFVSYVAKKSFGGINGDVMGASNELARCITLFIWAVLL